jgi:hypothetical protein
MTNGGINWENELREKEREEKIKNMLEASIVNLSRSMNKSQDALKFLEESEKIYDKAIAIERRTRIFMWISIIVNAAGVIFWLVVK